MEKRAQIGKVSKLLLILVLTYGTAIWIPLTQKQLHFQLKYFCKGSHGSGFVYYQKYTSAILGPEEITFHSMDGKATVLISITTAKKQTPLVMHMEYQVTLPDHVFVVSSKHKLILTVIGDMKVAKSKDLTNDTVSYSGPTYIPKRSAKHCFFNILLSS